eukprot:TRINITY_DN70352_c0_g1_i1.p1 TRINITY_DN70352_c0_g1~~TRINITY_DN70352_c0_g1_i1.p1  ORF type:complete len:1229 (+),score=281.06 TRINITY_DN70352_c0_g1_i1:107-3793(+)
MRHTGSKVISRPSRQNEPVPVTSPHAPGGRAKGRSKSVGAIPEASPEDSDEEDGAALARPSFAKSRWKTAGMKLKAAIRFRLQRAGTDTADTIDAGTIDAGPAREGTGAAAARSSPAEAPVDADIQAIQKYAEDMMQKGRVRESMHGGSPQKTDKRKQVNPEYYTPEALAARKAIRTAPCFAAACSDFWDKIPKFARGMDRGMYMTVFSALASNTTLLPGSPGEEAALRALENEWAYDSQGIEWLDLSAFTDAVFDLVDTWTESVDQEQYAAVVRKFSDMFEQDPLPEGLAGEWHWATAKEPEVWRKCGASMGHHLENAFSRDKREQVPLPGLHVDPIGTACVKGVNVDFKRMHLHLGIHENPALLKELYGHDLPKDKGGEEVMTYCLKRLARRPQYVRKGMPGWVELSRPTAHKRGSVADDGKRHRDAEVTSPSAMLARKRSVRESNAGRERPASPPHSPGAGGALVIRCSEREFALPPQAAERLPDSVRVVLHRARRSAAPPAAPSGGEGAAGAAERDGEQDGQRAGQRGGQRAGELYQIQRDPTVFAPVAEFLASGTRPRPPGDPAAAAALMAEWDFWGLPLAKLLPASSSVLGHATVKLMRNRGGKTPCLQVDAGSAHQALCGHYQPIATGAGREGQPVWQCGDARLFSARGVWQVGSAEDCKRGNGQLVCAAEHGGKLPSDPTLCYWKSRDPDADPATLADDPEVAVRCAIAPSDLGVTHEGGEQSLCGTYHMLPRATARGWPIWERGGARDAWVYSDGAGRWVASKQRPKEAAGRKQSLHSPSSSPSSPPVKPLSEVSYVSAAPHHGSMPSTLTQWQLESTAGERSPAPAFLVRQGCADTKDPAGSPQRKMLKMIGADSYLPAHCDSQLGRVTILALLSQPWFAEGKQGTVEVEVPVGGEEVLQYALQYYRSGAVTLPPMDAVALRQTLRALQTVFGVASAAVRVAGKCRLFGFGFGGCPEDLRSAAAEDREKGGDIPHSVQGACLRCARLASELLAEHPGEAGEAAGATPQSPQDRPRGSLAQAVGAGGHGGQIPRRASSASPSKMRPAQRASFSAQKHAAEPDQASRPTSAGGSRGSSSRLSPLKQAPGGSAELRQSLPVSGSPPLRRLSQQGGDPGDSPKRSALRRPSSSARCSPGAGSFSGSPVARGSFSGLAQPTGLPSLSGSGLGGSPQQPPHSPSAQGRHPLAPLSSPQGAKGSPRAAAGSPARALRQSLSHSPH